MENHRIIALVDMNAFLASVEQALNPDLRGKPVIVGGEPGTRGIVICASYEARKLGVGFGVSLAEAYRRLPHAHFVKGDIKIYLDFWRKVQEIFDEYTPQIEPVSMDEGYLDLTGCRSRFAPCASWGNRSRTRSATGSISAARSGFRPPRCSPRSPAICANPMA